MAEVIVQEESLVAVANAIREKTGSIGGLVFPDGFVDAISAIQTDGSADSGGSVASVPMKDINFYDYDGTRIYSYTVAEAQALTKLPTLPTHKGLNCQGWNWTLEDIKAMSRAVDVGAMYITDDGKTRLYITIASDCRMTVPLCFSQTVENGVTIDWGDESAMETLSGTGNVNTAHTYANIGNYVITLDVANECTLGLSIDSSSCSVLGSTESYGRVYCNMLQKVELGSGVTKINPYAFQYCYSLANITIPNNVTRICSYAFRECYSLTHITIPNGVTRVDSNSFNECHSLANITIPNSVTLIDSYAFRYCYSLTRITIPNGVTNISNYEFSECHSLTSIIIPNSVASIGNGSFYKCYGICFYDFTGHTAVPTLSNKNAFDSIPSDCQIRVPAALYDEWIAATNWLTYASQIVAV